MEILAQNWIENIVFFIPFQKQSFSTIDIVESLFKSFINEELRQAHPVELIKIALLIHSNA